jgi:hypothetical protein
MRRDAPGDESADAEHQDDRDDRDDSRTQVDRHVRLIDAVATVLEVFALRCASPVRPAYDVSPVSAPRAEILHGRSTPIPRVAKGAYLPLCARGRRLRWVIMIHRVWPCWFRVSYAVGSVAGATNADWWLASGWPLVPPEARASAGFAPCVGCGAISRRRSGRNRMSMTRRECGGDRTAGPVRRWSSMFTNRCQGACHAA